MDTQIDMEVSHEDVASMTDIHSHVNKLGAMISGRYERLEKAEKNLENKIERFNQAHRMVMSFKDPIKLNVGGKIFMTSKSTILKYDSMLAAMFSGRHELEVNYK